MEDENLYLKFKTSGLVESGLLVMTPFIPLRKRADKLVSHAIRVILIPATSYIES